MAVGIPPTAYLEAHYRSLIPGLPVKAPPPAPARAAEVRPLSSSAASPSAKQVLPVYEVAPAGEYVKDIAVLTLGRAERAADIATLNPKFTRDGVAMAGAILKLPADAKIPQERLPQ